MPSLSAVVPSTSASLRVLVVCEQRTQAERLLEDVRESGFRTTARWVSTAATCSKALGERDWDLALTPWPLPQAAQPLREAWESLSIVLIAERVDADVLADSQDLGALLCRMEGCRSQLSKVLNRIYRNVNERARERWQRAFEHEQARVLERIARGAPLKDVLEQIVRVIERHMEGACSILLLDRVTGRVRHGAAPSLPQEYVRAIDGAPIGPTAGSCGAAMYRAERVFVRDISSHPYWTDYKHLALPHGLASCWSTPIFSPGREVLGSFAVYYREPRDPLEDELHAVDTATHLAAIAILRERAEDELRASEVRYRQLIDTTHEGVVMLNFDARVSFANPRAATILGYEVSELVGRSVAELLDRSEVARIQNLLAEHTQNGGEQFELHMRTRQGADLWVILAASPILSRSHKMVGMLGMLTDITDRKHMEEALRYSEERLRTIFDASALGIALVDAETRPVKVNPALARILEREAEQLCSATLLSLLHPGDYSDFSAQKQRMDNGEIDSFRMEVRLQKDGGAMVWARVTASPIPCEEGCPQRSVFMLEDVSESKRLEAAVRSEERLRGMIYESVSDAIYYIGVESEDCFRFLSVNPAFCVTTGLAESDIVGRRVDEVIPPGSRETVLASYRRAIRLRRTIRWDEAIEYPAGTKYGEVSVTPLFGTDGTCTHLVGTVHDITERKYAEAKIAQQAALLNRSRDAIIVHGFDGTVRFWNEGAVRLYGWSREEAIGSPITRLIYRDAQGHDSAMAHLLSHGSWTGGLIHQDRDGQELTVESSWTLLRDPDDHPEGVLAIHTDVTEKAKLKAQVMLAQRMESLGTLAGGIAHDFNNLLTAIMGHLDLALSELTEDHPTRRRLAVIESAAGRAADLVNQILTFSRARETKRVPMHLEPVVEEALALLRATLPTMIQINKTICGGGFEVAADASQIHQVVLNLGTNAAHAMGSHGTMEVTLEPISITKDSAQKPAALKPGRYMRLAVKDDGCGMDAKTLKRIFDPFFSTKPPGQGTGLGLSVVHGIVKDHDGVLTVHSRPNQGSLFEIFLPEARAEARSTSPPEALDKLRGKGEHIVCVDDEEPVLALVVEVLRNLGYRATGFTDAEKALRALKADPEGVDAIVTDFAMPVMTGTELAAAAHALRPELPVFLTSGYLRSEEAKEAERLGIRAVLSKPHFVEPLARELFRSLHEESSEDDD